ncbi:MAG: CU044_2847 family protein [Thiohalocapsa sp.]
MARLVELDLGDGQSVLVEADDQISIPRSAIGEMAYQRGPRDAQSRASIERVQNMLRGFADGAVAALRDIDADVERVRLEFAVSLGGDAGVPYVTKRKGEGMLTVTIDCNLAHRNQRSSLEQD